MRVSIFRCRLVRTRRSSLGGVAARAAVTLQRVLVFRRGHLLPLTVSCCCLCVAFDCCTRHRSEPWAQWSVSALIVSCAHCIARSVNHGVLHCVHHQQIRRFDLQKGAMPRHQSVHHAGWYTLVMFSHHDLDRVRRISRRKRQSLTQMTACVCYRHSIHCTPSLVLSHRCVTFPTLAPPNPFPSFARDSCSAPTTPCPSGTSTHRYRTCRNRHIPHAVLPNIDRAQVFADRRSSRSQP